MPHRTRTRIGIVLAALLGLGLPTIGQASAAPATDAITDLQVAAGGPLEVRRADDGRLRFLGGDGQRPLSDAGDPTANAAAVLGTLQAELRPAAGSAVAAERTSSTSTGTAVRFRQTIGGVPVLAGEIAVQTDTEGRVLSLLGETTDESPATTTPAIGAADAAATARQATSRQVDLAAEALVASEPELLVYDPDLVGSPDPRGTRLVWQVRVTGPATGEPIAHLVLVDATTGGIALQIDDLHAAKDRKVCDRANTSAPYECTGSYARVEGGPATGVTDVNNAYDFSGDVYDYFSTEFGRDSLDDAGMSIISTVRWCPSTCPFANAFWEGDQIVYGPGFASADDVVGHELTHGVTEHEANLFYFMQSGAINESMSDIFGELVDLGNGAGTDTAGVRWLMGEDLPGGAGRDLKNPPAFGQPDRMQSPLYWSDLDDNGGVHFNSGVGNKAAYLLVDGATFNGQTVTAIGATKTARIFYEVLTAFLVSGSDYADLAQALPQACTNLIGTVGIASGDCDQVRKAIVATEMDRQPVTGAAEPDAPECDIVTQSPTPLYTEDWETGTDGWSVNTDWALEDGTTVFGDGAHPAPYATSGVNSMLGLGLGVPTDRRVTRTGDVAVPTDRPAYLRFNHVFDFEPTGDGVTSYEGGVLEYSTNGGGSWTDAVGMISENGYNGFIVNGFANPLAGRYGWTQFSWGWDSVRLDLSPLAGQNVRFRWRMGTDNLIAYAVWILDDIEIYTCEPLAAGYHPVTPARLLDTRDGTGGTTGKVAGGTSIDLQVTGEGDVPETGVSAVALNVTAVGPTAASHATVWPAGVGMPLASNLNFVAGQTIPNLVKVGVGEGGRVSFFNNAGAVDFIADVVGWYDEGGSFLPFEPSAVTGDKYNAVTPTRLLDTRDGTGGTSGKVGAASTIDLTVAGAGPVPADATAVAINMTVTAPTAASHLTVWPKGVTMPLASNLNFNAGTTIPNMVIVGVGSGGKISIFNNSGQTHVIGDVVGYFRSSGAQYVPVTPARVLDTRDGTGGTLGKVTGGSSINLTVEGVGGVPASGVTAVVLNVTAVGGTAPSHVTVWPNGVTMPLASNLNFSAGQTIPNLVMVGVGTGGQVKLFNNSGSVDLIADVVGYYVVVP